MRVWSDYYHFDVVDYTVFASMLFLSAMTGVYYGWRSKYRKSEVAETLREYLTGSKTMRPFPVAMSLVASYISGITILGTPAEIYNFGTQYWIIIIPIWLSGLAVAFVYLPVFSKLEVNSSYEYLEMRFNRTVRTLASILFVMDEIMFLPILVYVPSLAFNQVTGINLHLIGTIVCIVCIFYTVLGGLKAVVWTDTWQIIVMFISTVVVVILGTTAVGGTSVIWERSEAGQRIEFLNFSTSMYERHTVIAVLIGGFIYWTSFNSVNQTMVQRYLSLPNLKQSTHSIGIFTVGVSAFVSLCCFSGLLVFATYYDCDPLTAGKIKADDQLLPVFVMQTVGHLRGVPGLFIAGVFGAALSSLSVVLNSTSTVLLEDFIKGCMRLRLPESTASIFVKCAVVFLGAVAVGFLFIVEHMGGVLSTATSLSAIAAGTTFGVFSLGMLVPWANSHGALFGGIAGAFTSGLVSLGSQYVGATGLVVPHKLPISVDGCFDSIGTIVNATTPVYPDESNIFPLFRLSYHWITPIGFSTVMIVGIIVSFLTGKVDISTLDPDVISPVFQWILPVESHRFRGTVLQKIRRREYVEFDESLMTERPVSTISSLKVTVARFPTSENDR